MTDGEPKADKTVMVLSNDDAATEMIRKAYLVPKLLATCRELLEYVEAERGWESEEDAEPMVMRARAVIREAEAPKHELTIDANGGLVLSAEAEAELLAKYDQWKESRAAQDSDAQAEPPPEATQAPTGGWSAQCSEAGL